MFESVFSHSKRLAVSLTRCVCLLSLVVGPKAMREAGPHAPVAHPVQAACWFNLNFYRCVFRLGGDNIGCGGRGARMGIVIRIDRSAQAAAYESVTMPPPPRVVQGACASSAVAESHTPFAARPVRTFSKSGVNERNC